MKKLLGNATANIIPIYKIQNPSDTSNYRHLLCSSLFLVNDLSICPLESANAVF